MDISLPVSEGPAAGVFAGAASSRSAANGKFSQTLSKEMSEQPGKDSVSGETNASQQAQPGTAASLKHAGHAEDTEQTEAEENASESPAESTTEASTEPGKGTKKAAQDDVEASPVNPGINTTPAVTPEQKSILDSLKLLTGTGEATTAEETGKEKAVTPAALDKATSPAPDSVLANASTNPALLRSNAIHNEIFNSLRTQRLETPATEAGSYADSLLSGKSLQSSGKNLPPSGKADKQLNSFLPAGAQDWKYTADTLITAVSDKSVKFEAFALQFDSQSAESFSLVNAGSGKSLLAPQAGLKSELASPATAYTSLASEFLAGSEEWCQDFGTKIEWMNNENVTKAELRLHPAELGVLDITINTEDDRISINIVTHNEKSREMLESSLPRLTELLKSQGLALENSNISHNSSSDKQNAHAQQPANPFGLSADEKHAAEVTNVRSALIRHQGQIDHYV